MDSGVRAHLWNRLSQAGRRWRYLHRLEKTVWIIVALCALTALLSPRLLIRTDPELAVGASYRRAWNFYVDPLLAPPSDPWGNEWVSANIEGALTGEFVTYSVGPNGVNEGGKGDDVVVHAKGTLPLLAAWASEVLFALALLLAWLVRGPYVRAPRSHSLLVELWRATALASLPSCLFTLVVLWDLTHAPWTTSLFLPGTERVLVPVCIATLGSLWVLSYVVSLGYRLSR